MKKIIGLLLAVLLLITSFGSVAAAPKNLTVNVLLNTAPTFDALKELKSFGKISYVYEKVDAIVMSVAETDLEALRAHPLVLAATPDAERSTAPVHPVAVTDFANGIIPWDLDVMNIGQFPTTREVSETGAGVYVAVLDTGLVDTWRAYFPEERIATEYAIAFAGGVNENASVPDLKNKWEHDTNSHGTHVTSSILGYSMRGTPVNGVAPLATVIPVKVLNQNGSGSSGMVAMGIEYVGMLKEGPLADYPVVINMSLGGSMLDPVEKAAIDYAIGQGVIIVASAGNSGEAGMGYPGAYEPVISVAASGWLGEWMVGSWWYAVDDPDPNITDLYYITDFSSRELEEQDLDVAAPGSWIVGPYKLNSGKAAEQLSYYYLGGTSMASPHVAGLVALMMEKDPTLTAGAAEGILESTAMPMWTGCVTDPYDGVTEICWGADATGSGIVDAVAALAAMP
ncbi:MAG: S8 family serine peptidase [Anaerolineaceae bacterium]|nr:S8 family serine peptidase [Anaerolineaceae bacterium]